MEFYAAIFGLFVVLIMIRIQHLFGKNTYKGKEEERKMLYPQGFQSGLVILCAAMMKMESRSKRDEFIFFRSFYEKQFHQPMSSDVIELLRFATVYSLPISRICYRLKYKIIYEERILLMHFLYGFTKSDLYVSDAELRMIRLMGLFMGIESNDLDSLNSFYFSTKDSENPISGFGDPYDSLYNILGVSKTAEQDEIRKAYRQLAMKHHPDKVAHLGLEMQESAKQKFQIIVDAYKQIKKQRGFTS